MEAKLAQGEQIQHIERRVFFRNCLCALATDKAKYSRLEVSRLGMPRVESQRNVKLFKGFDIFSSYAVDLGKSKIRC